MRDRGPPPRPSRPPRPAPSPSPARCRWSRPASDLRQTPSPPSPRRALPWSLASKPVHAGGGAVEHGVLLILRKAIRDAFERVPQHRVRAARLVDGEIAFEHAAVWAEELDAAVVVVARGLRQLLRAGRTVTLLPPEAVDGHVHAPELRDHIRACRHCLDVARPVLVDLLELPRVRPDAERAAEVVENDRGVREGAGEVGDLGKLRVVGPRLEREPQRRQVGEAAPELLVPENVL